MDPEGPLPLEEIRRHRRTEALRSTLPYSARWESWLETSGESAPDFDLLVPRPRLWSPVEGLAGAGQWPARALAIRSRLAHWVLGNAPEATPGADVDFDVMAERRQGGTIDRALEVTLADGAARVRARLLMPAEGTAFPTVLTTSAHAWWAAAALRRGWATCLVQVADGRDDSDGLAAGYPAAQWSRLARRAWALGRVVDALAEMAEIDPLRIVAAAHGPDAKVALVAAADDPRIAAVAASSSGLLGAIPARLCAERHFGPGIEGLTRHHPDWFHPRLRFFSGREHLLPTDAHELLALLAPRPVLVSVATGDPGESTWAAERAIDAVRPAYELLGAPAATLALRWRHGGGECTLDAWEEMLDWADQAVGRAGTAPGPARRLHLRGGITWPPPIAPNRTLLEEGELAMAIAAALGPEPPAAADPVAPPLPEPAHVSALLRRAVVPLGLTRHTVRTADGVAVDVFVPDASEAPSPLLLWLGPLARATGYGDPLAGRRSLWQLLAADGWAVACLDQIGTGARLHEEGAFRGRHPGWSLLGGMARDARGALAAAATLPGVDAAAPYIAGYGAGALAALHVAALEPAVAGVAALAPAAGDVPLLARDARYGIADLLAGLGTRPALVMSAAIDPESDAGDLADVVASARAEGAIVEHAVLQGHNRLSGAARKRLRTWLAEAACAGRALA